MADISRRDILATCAQNFTKVEQLVFGRDWTGLSLQCAIEEWCNVFIETYCVSSNTS